MEYDLEELLANYQHNMSSGSLSNNSSNSASGTGNASAGTGAGAGAGAGGNGAAESSTSSSLSSSDNTLLNFFRLPTSAGSFHHPAAAVMASSSHLSPQTIASALAESNTRAAKTESNDPLAPTTAHSTSMPNSCSLIFSTAASFNINQQVIYIYYIYLARIWMIRKH